jgi:hypothetical protein
MDVKHGPWLRRVLNFTNYVVEDKFAEEVWTSNRIIYKTSYLLSDIKREDWKDGTCKNE